MIQKDCIFCQIVKGSVPSFKIWENKDYLAFLDIFPNTKGATLVITKDHYQSYFAELPVEVLSGLMHASQQVSLLLDRAFLDVGRTGLIFEGLGVNHIHAKLYPMHGTKTDKWESQEVEGKFYEIYPGFVASHPAKRANNEELEKIANMIRNSIKTT